MPPLFGGFETGFYEAYAWHYPLPDNHREQWAIANLYPLLVHLNLFGSDLRVAPQARPSIVPHATLGYLSNILDTIQGF